VEETAHLPSPYAVLPRKSKSKRMLGQTVQKVPRCSALAESSIPKLVVCPGEIKYRVMD
jgi:hypothetical protein